VPRLVEALMGKKVIGTAAGNNRTAVWTEAGELFTFGHGHGVGKLGHGGQQNELGQYGRLGHGGLHDELVPRLVEALVGKKVIGAAASNSHTVVWTDEGELFTFGAGCNWQLGHGLTQIESVPRLVEAFAAKNVVGATASDYHTAVWTDAGELFTFGDGEGGQLGQGRERWEHVPRLVGALADE